ncbi:SH3 domain-containing protein [Helicobacter sp. 11S03491-1]|uniref:SH3 domain-containing protein n=1 Tax=Helicobacter sp. 11S03491-1 TaxID=1476196 RepID=UPI000BA789C1|nr:SH3 domain-containing protein [Helicobacter sp. 11S03491-1]PAF42041.1 hypothetical protein BKH45_05530 [Helicobacter sp. 11S03491-1]
MNIKSFFKLYTMPVLALFFGFGLYYIVFVGTSKQKEFSISENTSTQVVDSTHQDATKDIQEPTQPNQTNTQTHVGQNILNEDMFQSQVSTSEIPNNNSLPAQANPQTYIVIPKAINIRQSPGTTSDIVGKLTQNQKIEVSFIAEGWAKVKEGWILSSLLKQDKEDILATSPSALKKYIVIPRSVNIRLNPDISSKIIGKILHDEVVEVAYTQNGWAKVKEGWVWLSLLKKQANP